MDVGVGKWLDEGMSRGIDGKDGWKFGWRGG